MIWTKSLGLLPVVAVCLLAQTKSASIAGKVLDSAGAPVRRAVVSVEGEGRDSQRGKAMTSEDGAYIITGLPKGRFWISAEKTGFLRRGYRGRTADGFGDPVTLETDSAKTGIDITLPRQGVISGRVVDEAGEPAERVLVQALAVRKQSGRGGPAGMGITNDLGEFRIAKLSPGSYRLLASRTMDRGELLVDRVPGKAATAEAPTYFPGTVDPLSASPVKVNPGEERTGAEIRLQRSTVVRLAGRVAGELPASRGARVSLRGNSDTGMGRGGPMGGGEGAIGTDGAFELRNVRPGEYSLTVTQMDRGGPKTLGRQTVSVGQQDVLGLTINAAAPPKVDGRIRADGDPPFAFGTLDLTLNASGNFREFGPPANVKSDENGNFSFAAVSRERLSLTVKTPAGIIVKSIYAAGQPLPGMEIDFSVISGPLEIVLSNKPATITGIVEGVNPDSPRVAVWAVPDSEPFVLQSGGAKKLRVASDAPSFTLDSLRPGTYRVVAFEDSESDVFNDPVAWEQVKAQTATVKVAEGESAQVKLKLIPAREFEGS